MIVIMNSCRQIVFTNNLFLNYINNSALTNITGKRLGEVLKCFHLNETLEGCGTGENCRTCGAFEAIFESHYEKK
jgi:hypothetical protein